MGKEEDGGGESERSKRHTLSAESDVLTLQNGLQDFSFFAVKVNIDRV